MNTDIQQQQKKGKLNKKKVEPKRAEQRMKCSV